MTQKMGGGDELGHFLLAGAKRTALQVGWSQEAEAGVETEGGIQN